MNASLRLVRMCRAPLAAGATAGEQERRHGVDFSSHAFQGRSSGSALGLKVARLPVAGGCFLAMATLDCPHRLPQSGHQQETRLFQGHTLRVHALGEPGVFELCFDRSGEPINKLDDRTVGEFREAVAWLARQTGLRGVIVTSAKDVFIVGADITEFGKKFSKPAAEIAADLAHNSAAFTAFEDLPVPTVVAINGFALGGGLEMALAASGRVMASTAQVGVPEVKLGIFPGYGGTVRLARLAGPAHACDWVASGRPSGAEVALAAGVVDAVAQPDALRDAALQWLNQAMVGEIDWAARQQRKRDAVACSPDELRAVFAAAHDKQARTGAPHQPAAAEALRMMEQAANLDRAAALALEVQVLGEVARTQAAFAMTQTFLDEQAVKKRARAQGRQAQPVRQAVVLGAGIMGGGIAYTSALHGVPVRMKDIAAQALEQGMAEARKQASRRVKAGRLDEPGALQVLQRITPQGDDAGLETADVVVEAIVERLEIKQKVLTDLETRLRPGAIIASNTSSLRIDDIGAPLRQPQNLVGMHFFNPVHVMPLVEIVRGSRTSDAAVATATGYALAMGKTPIVVKDCPGFLVNRLLTAYMRGFLQLVADGADFEQVDRVMEAFGWPMGPAYLEDVVGLDTGSHVNDVISAGYPQRMPALAVDALRAMVRAGRLGQKNGAGFYRYEPNPQGKPLRVAAPEVRDLLAPLQPGGVRAFDEAEIVDRMMLPMVVEAAHALEEGVVATPAELDVALLLGLGFPAYAGGPLKYADWLGLAEVVRRCEHWRHLGAAFEPTLRMRQMAREGQRFHTHEL